VSPEKETKSANFQKYWYKLYPSIKPAMFDQYFTLSQKWYKIQLQLQSKI